MSKAPKPHAGVQAEAQAAQHQSAAAQGASQKGEGEKKPDEKAAQVEHLPPQETKAADAKPGKVAFNKPYGSQPANIDPKTGMSIPPKPAA